MMMTLCKKLISKHEQSGNRKTLMNLLEKQLMRWKEI